MHQNSLGMCSRNIFWFISLRNGYNCSILNILKYMIIIYIYKYINNDRTQWNPCVNYSKWATSASLHWVIGWCAYRCVFWDGYFVDAGFCVCCSVKCCWCWFHWWCVVSFCVLKVVNSLVKTWYFGFKKVIFNVEFGR